MAAGSGGSGAAQQLETPPNPISIRLAVTVLSILSTADLTNMYAQRSSCVYFIGEKFCTISNCKVQQPQMLPRGSVGGAEELRRVDAAFTYGMRQTLTDSENLKI
jgi:hypothetical protein